MSTTQNGLSEMHADDVAAIDELRDVYAQLKASLAKIIIGQEQVYRTLGRSVYFHKDTRC